MREFVDALAGLGGDLRAAASGTETSLRLALLGPVSPLGLARAVRQTVASRQRSPPPPAPSNSWTALWRVANSLSDPERRSLFEKHAGSAHVQLSILLEELRAEHPAELGTMTTFQC